MPVIIVPATVIFTKIEEVILAWDFKKVDATIAVAPIKKLLDITHPKLFVLNILRRKDDAEDAAVDTTIVDNLLQGYNPQYHFVTNDNFTEAMNDFAEEKLADLIITFPKKHGWLHELLNPGYTKQLAFHSNYPLMIVHD